MSTEIKRRTIVDDLRDAYEAMTPSEKMKSRRAALRQSWTRFLARKPIGPESAGPLGAKWRVGMESWVEGWAASRAASTTVRRGRRAEKQAHHDKRAREVRAMRKLRRLKRRLDVLTASQAIPRILVPAGTT